tara:strand:- start:209 stop:523 length:315 start_codon:yes stop_codon:yes gene_type:complete
MLGGDEDPGVALASDSPRDHEESVLPAKKFIFLTSSMHDPANKLNVYGEIPFSLLPNKTYTTVVGPTVSPGQSLGDIESAEGKVYVVVDENVARQLISEERGAE